jgi:putative RNA 2'-phosphotransferase
MDKNLLNKSKFISLVLRHKPEEIGLTLDGNGWADVNELLDKSRTNGPSITFDELKKIVETNEKKRFSFNDDLSKIRANQGHSVEVDVRLNRVAPPEILYHGTAERFLNEILNGGLKKMNRLHVHLTDNYETAVKVGMRHGKPVVLAVSAKVMHEEGAVFYLSENSVWLVEHVEPHYLKKIE